MSSGDKCPVCGGAVKDNESACSVCGTVFTPDQAETTEIVSEGITCPDCGNLVPEGEKVCDECGSRVGSGSEDDYEDYDDHEDDAIKISIDNESPDEVDDIPIELDEDFDLDNLDQHMENLLKLPGVGPLRAKILLEAGYDDLRKLKRASVMELVKVKGIGRKSAGEIKTALRDIDLEEIRKKKLDRDQIEDELSCPLCNTIVSVYEVACYECGTALKDHHDQVVEGDPDSMALAYYDTKLKEDPANAELWYARGATLIKMEEFDKALASFDKSLEIDPAYQNVWISKAEVYNKMGEPMKAAECYSHVISASTDSDDDYQEIGNGFDLSEPVEDTFETEVEPIVEQEPEEIIEPEIESTVTDEDEQTEEPEELIEEPIDQDDGLGDEFELSSPSEPSADSEEETPEQEMVYEDESSQQVEDEPAYEEVDQEPDEFIEENPVEVTEEEPTEEIVVEEESPPETIELVEAEPEPTPEPEMIEQEVMDEPELIEAEEPIQPAQEIKVSQDDMIQVQEEAKVEDTPPEPQENLNDPKVLKKTLSIHAVAIKPLLILAKELSIDVLAQKKIISQGVNESKKQNLSGAVALMKQGRRQIEEAFVAKANENLGAIADMSRELKMEGHEVDRVSDVISLAKGLLEQGSYKESFDKMNVALAMVENIRAEG